VPALDALAASRHPVLGVVSQPDRPRGRGRSLEPTPVHACAQRHSVPVLQPEKIGEPGAIEWMRALDADIGVVVAFGQFLGRTVRELPRLGMINAHASLLPRHRGAAPIAHAILCGDAETGISVMRVAREMDAGDVCLERRTPIGAEETAGDLALRLAPLAGEALLEALDAIAAGTAEFRPQDAALATLAGKLDRSMSMLDWRRPRAELVHRILGLSPWPGCDVELARSGRVLRILRARCGPPFHGPSPAAGRVTAEDGALRIAAVDGWVDVVSLQEPGRKPLDAVVFLRGARIAADEEVQTP
jgi:methionyl-tRNA formyltransferase